MTEETIFAAALELPPADRAAYLADACGQDSALRKRLEGLLAASDRAGGFMARPAVAPLEPPDAHTKLVDRQGSPNAETVSRVGPERAADDDEVPLGFLAPGQRPDSLGRIGHYEVLEVLGKGGFGIVFRAFDDVLQRVVALKVMAPQLAATSPARKRFLREARSSAQVRHENVVQVYEVAEQPLPYLAMEFIPGETLQQRLDRTGPVEPAEVVRVGRQIAEGLAAAHAMDLIHRDIKPGNVLLESGQQRVKITDFGLARTADDASISQSGIIAGTPMYMAPEQAKGETLDQRADLFSLGSVLYQMAAGRPPFRANSTVAVLKRVAEDTPRDIREIIPETPRWLCDIIAKLHAKDPDDRYQSAREVADVLADCEAQLKENAKLKDYSRIPRGKPPVVRRRRSGVMLLVIVLVVLLGLGAIGSVAVVGVLWLLAPINGDGQPSGRPEVSQVVVTPGSDPTPIVAAKPGPPPPHFKNSLGMEFMIVPKGRSWLGGGRDRPGDKEVKIPADFYMGRYEVTQEEWQKVTGSNPSVFKSVPGVSPEDQKRFPVENVSWEDIQSFLKLLNARTKEAGWVYRLPTQTEWEYACRGGPMSDRSLSGFDIYCEEPANQLDPTRANVRGKDGKERPCEVGSYRPNRLGLYDMHGNVWEWCDDLFDPNDPDPIKASLRPIRGGCYVDTTENCRASIRHANTPSLRSSYFGFRLARVPSDTRSPEAKMPPPAVAPFTDADVRRIAALPAEQQVEEVRKELVRRNPGFDGKFEHKIEGGVVTEFRIVTDHVTDIAPIRVWKGLQYLDCRGTWPDKPNGLLVDLPPLGGMTLSGLTYLNLGANEVSDAGLICFKDCKRLSTLKLAGTKLSDAGLAYFRGVPLRALQIEGTGVTDLTPLRGCRWRTSA